MGSRTARWAGAVLLVLAGSLTDVTAVAGQLVPCSGAAGRDVAEALTLITRNAGRISSSWVREQVPLIKDGRIRNRLLEDGDAVRKRFDQAWTSGEIRVVCGPCDDSPGMMGQSLAGRTVLVCYRQHVAMDVGFCELVDTLVHEAVHQIGLPVATFHSASRTGSDDPVYRFGWAAGALCRDGGWERRLAG